MLRPSHAATEHEGWQLKVDDSEIKVPRYLSAADRAAAEKHKLEEEARTRESSKDNAIARALEGMMGGTLEVCASLAASVLWLLCTCSAAAGHVDMCTNSQPMPHVGKTSRRP